MAQIIEPTADCWTAADLFLHFGPIPLLRVRFDPAPGTASESDVIEIHDREDRLYELVEGTLVEKAVGTYESFLALFLGRMMGNFVAEHDLGIVLGADGMMRLAPGLIRIPDVSFISWNKLPNFQIPDQPIADLVPDLAVEVISKGNTAEEMQRKLREYFDAGVRLVWYAYPDLREVRVYTATDECIVKSQQQNLDGGDVLPGFNLKLTELFSKPA